MAQPNGQTYGGDTTQTGGNGRDTLVGATTDDTLIGGGGRDTLIGDSGNVTVDQAATSFEFHDDFSNGSWGLFEEAGGWRYEGTHLIELQSSGLLGQASDGDTVLELDSTGNSTVYRDFQGLDTAMDFTLSLDFSARRGVSAASNTIEILWNDTVLDRITADGVGQTGFNWTTHSWTVAPTANGEGRITLRGIGTEDTLGGIVDNVRLEGALDGFDPAVDGGNDLLQGGNGNDVLDGGAGNDLLEGGSGRDDIDGGAGTDDVVSYIASRGRVHVHLDTGAGRFGEAQGDTIRNVENAIGSANNDELRGDENANRLNGYYGDDDLQGLGGDDHLVGHEGADVIDGGDGIDTAVYTSSGGGVDVSLLRGTGLGYHAEGDTLLNIERLDGSRFADRLEGDDGRNRLTGRNGEDTLLGLGGNDELEGGGGADVLDGGAGTDTARYTKGRIGVDVDLLRGTGLGGEAQGDTLSNIENLLGSDHADRLTGDDGVNRLNGGAGDDTLDGGAGNDRLVGGLGADTFIGGLGNDTVDYGDAEGGVVVSLLSGGTGGEAAGDTFDGVEALQGSDFADTLEGDGSNNRLTGGAGGDILLGGAGNDTLVGALGADELTGGAGDDVFLFTLNFGDDLITDFEAGAGRTDRIWLRDMGLAFADLDLADTDDGALLRVGDDTLTLAGLLMGDLVEDDFIL